MQGRQEMPPQWNWKIYYQVSLNDLVPQDNFYRKLSQELDLNYLYKSTAQYYGREGQESIDPVVFFKILRGLSQQHQFRPKIDFILLRQFGD